ncbi:MAG: bifunctional methylenetetrahydrofolate dehydrogenase/methenyltetrahydrofolate cyclohydrolase FolD [Alphaproteobacteria bacterium]|nr:MAG: bifunctional methylenetetrahydrofolate dehydrogenase/methenyltetrahydrofolate cyclohydrolase FolD [Alphaproteobacteria bacterium]
MTAQIIDGKAFAENLKTRLTAEVASLREKHGLIPGLATVLIGADPASQSYVGSKKKTAAAIGFHSIDVAKPADITQDELLQIIAQLNADEKIHGILVQLPLPKHISEEVILGAIDPRKDVDGFHDVNAGKLAKGKPGGFVPCTPWGCLMLLKHHLGDLSGKKAVVMGRSNIVGAPMAQLLRHENCTVTVVHSKTRDLPGECKQADILIAAIGKPEMVTVDYVKPGACVIDVGINRIATPDGKGKLVGDVNFAAVKNVAGFITPVPGGVGPMTIACLMDNTIKAACQIHNIARK